MGRPARHTADDLLDAAIRLFATEGARGVTMSAVARAVGAPSGSVYHRFPDRPALLAGAWLRTVDRFQDGYLEVLAREPAEVAAVEAAAHVVRWCRKRPDEGKVLQAGRREFGPDRWSAEDHARAERAERRLESALRAAVRRLRPVTGAGTEEVMLVLVDLPHAVARRYLARGEPPPPRAVDLITRAARTLLASGRPHPTASA
ncbi:TetR/AcrR family transcriptional regulator [Amycolatopsis cihanbeyliensis]|uniref:TetR family transcriptional regulator n=1 Tax=Amycolatopsis cihanbeyliensis TaxID=1128664 RepID=A0A542CU79_AMYCI|nr:TetR/AcrR family transcriptional regulator [Amycolatopsis cihanbeyliensis]TQI94379.1 TetR family transcriptional regulator [Amycolatopsis cihanbeyliensis]